MQFRQQVEGMQNDVVLRDRHTQMAVKNTKIMQKWYRNAEYKLFQGLLIKFTDNLSSPVHLIQDIIDQLKSCTS